MREYTEDLPSRIGPCLNELDFYDFVTGSKGERPHGDLRFHLIRCDACYEELVAVLELLEDDAEEDLRTIGPPSEKEIQETISLIQNASRKVPASPR